MMCNWIYNVELFIWFFLNSFIAAQVLFLLWFSLHLNIFILLSCFLNNSWGQGWQIGKQLLDSKQCCCLIIVCIIGLCVISIYNSILTLYFIFLLISENKGKKTHFVNFTFFNFSLILFLLCIFIKRLPSGIWEMDGVGTRGTSMALLHQLWTQI